MVTTMAPTGSNDYMDWLPGLGNSPHSGFNSESSDRAELETDLSLKRQAADPEVDEVIYSIVCDNCGKHFWSRSKAESHAALTAHVLREEIMSLPCSPVTNPNSPAASSASAPDMNTLFTSRIEAEASLITGSLDQEDSGDSEDEEHSLCFDCGRHFWSHEAANNHAKIGHLQDTEMVPSSAPDRSPTFAAAGPAVTPTSSAASPSINPSTLYWNAGPGTASLATNGGTIPASQYWTPEQTTGRAISPTFPIYNGGVNPTSPHWTTEQMTGHATSPTAPVYDRGVNPTSPHWTTERTTGRAISPTSPVYNGGVNPTSMYGTFSPTRGGAMAVFRKQTDPPSPGSSCATLENPQVIFPSKLSDRIFFIVTPSGKRKGPSFIMSLAEAQNAVTFRAGVRGRLESQGEQVGLREIVARIPWLSVPVYSDSNEDHYHMLMVVRHWPEWQKTNGHTSCHIFVTLEDEEEDKEAGEKQQEIRGKAEN